MPSKTIPPEATAHLPSPGNDYSHSEPSLPRMRMPHLEFIYRIVADMDKGGVAAIEGVDSTHKTRLYLPIQGGTVHGPRIKGVIVDKSGADWAEVLSPKKSFIRLNAMYMLKTDDNVHILVKAQGVYRSGPGLEDKVGEQDTVSQDEVEYFTHIRFEAPGKSRYGWMNGVVAIGVMTMWHGKPVIDCYRLTNFPGRVAANL
ncbi:hypothetical protein FSPOR_1615 [Fusarium sporotrichioides]|uniref:Uncharacterized protein n=1 Tax=Fusarium sporotrichioides TaxID=5514 RepID=A0A395SNA2_FUSSP|nr:hypothetical protein FSPOR_1615 [Fusarium sporotrichioides]